MSTTDTDKMGLALWDAIDAAGGTCSLARQLGITAQAVSLWDVCPVKRVIAVEQLTGISRFRLRPDHFAVAITTKAQLRRKQAQRKKADRPNARKPIAAE